MRCGSLGANDVLVFVTSALAIIPLAGLIGAATDEAAKYVGAGLGGFLSATFGNAAELIIALLALQRGLTEVVKASLTGQHPGQFAAGARAGDVRRRLESRQADVQQTNIGAPSGMLVLTVVALLMPDIYAETLASTMPLQAPNIMQISVLVAIVMLVRVRAPAWSFRSGRTATCSAASTSASRASPEPPQRDHAAGAGHAC